MCTRFHITSRRQCRGVSVVFSSPKKLFSLSKFSVPRKEPLVTCSKKHRSELVKWVDHAVYRFPLVCGKFYINQSARCPNSRWKNAVAMHTNSMTVFLPCTAARVDVSLNLMKLMWLSGQAHVVLARLLFVYFESDLSSFVPLLDSLQSCLCDVCTHLTRFCTRLSLLFSNKHLFIVSRGCDIDEGNSQWVQDETSYLGVADRLWLRLH